MIELSKNSILIINIVGVLVIVVMLWGIAYFLTRIFTHYYIRSQLGDMPTPDEIAELYKQNNDIIEYRTTPPPIEK